jgi:hypothetical protein
MDAQFLAFVELFGVSLSAANFQVYNDLYGHFKEFRTSNADDSFERKFILWKNQSDNAMNANLEIPPPPPPPPRPNTPPPVLLTQNQLVENKNHMPHKLQQLADVTINAFHNFTLEQTPVVLTHTENTETVYGVMKSEAEAIEQVVTVEHPLNIGQQQTPKPRGKNIDILKAAYIENLETSTAPEMFTTNTRKRKRPVKKVQGSGRPTYDDSMVRIANDSSDDASLIPLNSKQLLLLTSTGEIRKKTTIYTKHENDIKCFAIKHYASFCYLAERRKKALEKIKKQRTKLEQLNYMETNLIPLVKDNDNF